MTDHEAELLTDMHPGEWYRPIDLGGTGSNHVSRRLRRMCEPGWVEHTPKPTGMERGAYRYRITEKGRAALAVHQELKGVKI